MKIYKINVDPSNPIEHKIKVPVNTPFGFQMIWDYDKYPTFPKDSTGFYPDNADTMTDGYLIPRGWVLNDLKDNKTIFPKKNGVKTWTDFKSFISEGGLLSKVGAIQHFYYAPLTDDPYESPNMNSKIFNWAHISVEIVPADSNIKYDMTIAETSNICITSDGIYVGDSGSFWGDEAGFSIEGDGVACVHGDNVTKLVVGTAYNDSLLSLVKDSNGCAQISAGWFDEDEYDYCMFSVPLTALKTIGQSSGGIEGLSAVGDAIVTDKSAITYVDDSGKLDTGALSAKQLDILGCTGIQLIGNDIGLSGTNIYICSNNVTLCGGVLVDNNGKTECVELTVGESHVIICDSIARFCAREFIVDGTTSSGGPSPISLIGNISLGSIFDPNQLLINSENSPICPYTAGNITAPGQLELSGANGVYVFADTTQFAKLTKVGSTTICSILSIQPLPALDRGMQIVGTNTGVSADQELVLGAGNGVTFSTSALTICGKSICLTKFLADYGS